MNYRKLAGLAIDVAHAAPIKPGHPTTSAYIPWPLIIEIRKECDRLGIPWAETHPKTKAEFRQSALTKAATILGGRTDV